MIEQKVAAETREKLFTAVMSVNKGFGEKQSEDTMQQTADTADAILSEPLQVKKSMISAGANLAANLISSSLKPSDDETEEPTGKPDYSKLHLLPRISQFGKGEREFYWHVPSDMIVEFYVLHICVIVTVLLTPIYHL